MNTMTELPKGYEVLETLDPIKDPAFIKKKRIASLIVGGLFFALFFFLVNPLVLLLLSSGRKAPLDIVLLRVLGLVTVVILYPVAREWLKSRMMRSVSGVKPTLSFSDTLAYAGSDAYFSPRAYNRVLLWPSILLALLSFASTLFLPVPWFWVGGLAVVMAFSGAMRDLLIYLSIKRLPAGVLIQDSGLLLTYYVYNEEAAKTLKKTIKGSEAANRKKQAIYGKKNKR
ncbi:hypothetical protein ABB02_01147 [Clostridiaceae bacterium JG1575]|nr:hypothetical protein ABB02_01147 [Clostridiaceae bacterium JG1575]